MLGKRSLFRVARLAVTCACLGWLYAWASPRVHPPNTRVGLLYGVAHGALMPMALPSLLMGKDVSIYSDDNTGRTYKIGYIAGINLCGLIVFGSAFWRSSRTAGSEHTPHIGAPE